MAKPANPINIPALGVSRDQNISLGIFLTQALQNPDWQEIKVKLPLKDEPLSLNRQQCQEILKQKILPDVFQKDSDFYSQVENLQDPKNLDLLGNRLIDEEIPGQTDPRTQQIREGYKLFMQNQATGAQTNPQAPAQILPASEARNTAKALSQIKTQLSDKIGQAVEDNLQKYPESYRQQVKKNLVEHLTHEALSELSSKNGRLTDETGNLNPHFANRVSHLFKTNPALRATIVNSQNLDQSLQENLAGTDQQAAQEAYNNFRKFQITAGPQYHQLANKLSPYLSNAEITRVISHLEGVPPGSNPLAIRQNLAAALSPYQNKLIKNGVNTTRLTNDLATGFQFFLNNPIARAGHHYHYSVKLRKLAKKMGIKDFQSPEEFQKLQALYAYTGGYSSEELLQLKEKGKILKTGSHGKIEIDDSLIEEVKAFENKRTHGPLRRWSAEDKIHRQYKKSAKRRQKIEKHQKWVTKMQTSRIGWLRTPMMRAKMAISKSRLAKGWQAWGKKVENYKDNGKLGWIIAPQRRFRRKVGNWIFNKLSKKFGDKAASKVANIVFNKGIGGLAKKAAGALITKGLAYVGLGAVSGGVVAIAGAVWEGTKAFYSIIKDPEKRKKVFSTVGLGGIAVVYLLFKFLITYPLTCLGIALGSPFGPIGMVIGGFIGNLADKIIGGLKGAASHLATTSATALEAAASLPTAAASIPIGFTAIAVPVLAPLIITFAAAWFTISTITSALSNPYGGTESQVITTTIEEAKELENREYSSDEEYDKSLINNIINTLQNLGIEQFTDENLAEITKILQDLLPMDQWNIIDEIQNSIKRHGKLQCVGFVAAIQKALGRQLPLSNEGEGLYYNAASYYYLEEAQNNSVAQNNLQIGDVAVWGPRNSCSVDNLDTIDKINAACADDINCCGHLGIVTGIENNGETRIVSVNGETGEWAYNLVGPNDSVEEGSKPWLYFRP